MGSDLSHLSSLLVIVRLELLRVLEKISKTVEPFTIASYLKMNFVHYTYVMNMSEAKLPFLREHNTTHPPSAT